MSDGIDRSDRRLYSAVYLSGLALAVAFGNATVDPTLITWSVVAGMLVVFSGLVWSATPPAENDLWCRLWGHYWREDPPWEGRDLGRADVCDRCGHSPDDIVITGGTDE